MTPTSIRNLVSGVCLGTALLASPSAAEIAIGVAVPATARQATLADDVARGVSAAVDRLNEAGGLLGERVKIISVDDGCDGPHAKAAAETLALSKPVAVFGHPCAAAAIAAAPVYAAAQIPFFAIGVRHPALTDKRAGPYVFRFAGRDDRQGIAAATALLAAAPGKKIAIVQDRTAYARSVLKDTTDHLAKAGVTPSPVLPIVAGKRDYPNEIGKLLEVKPEAVLFAGYPSEAVVLLRSMRKAGLTTVVIGSDALATPEFAETVSAADQASNRVQVLSPQAGATLSSTTGADKPDPAATHFTVQARAALEVWAAAVSKEHSLLPEAVARSLTGPPLGPTAAGEVSFDEKGDVRMPSFIAAVLVAGRWQAPPSETAR